MNPGGAKSILQTVESVAAKFSNWVNYFLDANTLELETQRTYGITYSAHFASNTGNGNSPDIRSEETLTVPTWKQAQLTIFGMSSVAASEATSRGIAALLASVAVPALRIFAVPLFLSEAGLLTVAQGSYKTAYDPPDPDYTHDYVATPLDVSELNALPDGDWKTLGLTALELQASVSGADVSRDRAQAAAENGDRIWESHQLDAVARYSADAATLSTRLVALYSNLLPSIQNELSAHAAEIGPYLQANGLPALEVNVLTRLGWSSNEIENVRQALVKIGGASLSNHEAGLAAFQNLAVGMGFTAADEAQKATAARVALGQSVRPLTPGERQTLDGESAAIDKAIAQSAPADSILHSIEAYLADVHRLLDSSNNFPTLQGDLEHAYSALVQRDVAGVTATDSSTPPILNTIADRTVLEGSLLSLAVTTKSAGTAQVLTYSLDPGAPAGAHIDPASGLFTWTPADGTGTSTYPLTIRVSDNGVPSLSDSKTFNITVNNVAPKVQIELGESFPTSTPLVRTGSFTDPGADTWTAQVDYGDGTPSEPVGLSPDRTFRLEHSYTAAGSYTVAVTVTDKDGGVGRNSIVVQVTAPRQVQPPPPLVTALPAAFSGGTPRRPAVQHIVLPFSGAVTAGSGAFELLLKKGRKTRPVAFAVTSASANGKVVITLSFSGRRGALPDGQYVLTIHGDKVLDSSGRPVDVNANGTAGGDRTAPFRIKRGRVK